MEQDIKISKDLIEFINESPTAFHAANACKLLLIKANFIELKLEDKWNLEKGGKYFFTRNDSSVIAFIVGTGDIASEGFRIIGAHTDSPSFRIKPGGEMISEGGYVKLNTEPYAGGILNTWMDRPLSIAGRVALKAKKSIFPSTALVNFKKPLLVIPNLAIHMNRNINAGIELNKQKDMLPLMGIIDDRFGKENYILKAISEELDVPITEISDFDLFLYEYEKGCIAGINDEFISSSRLDDLTMVHAALYSLLKSNASEYTKLVVFFDNEEVGSTTKQGAASPMLKNAIERVLIAFGLNREDFFRSLANSFIITADSAHACHPNQGEKYDPVNRPMINNGPVIKLSANQKYTTDSVSCTVYKEICTRAGVPYQIFVNRSDQAGGSTIGPISSTQLDIASVDIGTPLLAMHSIRELGGVLDQSYVIKSFIEFFK